MTNDERIMDTISGSIWGDRPPRREPTKEKKEEPKPEKKRKKKKVIK